MSTLRSSCLINFLLTMAACGAGADDLPSPVVTAQRPADYSVPNTPASSACPTSWVDAPHGGPCPRRGLTCSWNRTLDTRTAVCDGRGWRVVDLDRGCAAQPPSGACGQFHGACGYVVEGGYPGGGRPDYCLKHCSCDEGTWRCADTCSCPGKPADEPLLGGDSRYSELEGACLHDDMTCTYQYEVGTAGYGGAETLVRQPCTTTFTCNGKWGHMTACTCPVFSGGNTEFSWSCGSPQSLACQFPPEEPSGPQRQCRCDGTQWSCK
jgi:hypothetical protein